MAKFFVCALVLEPLTLIQSVCVRDSTTCTDDGNDCIAGRVDSLEGCSCAAGYTARALGTFNAIQIAGMDVFAVEYECCDDEDAPNIGEECGFKGCDFAPGSCTSPMVPTGNDCMAGVESNHLGEREGCTCSGGKVARVTGARPMFDACILTDYRCCPVRAAELMDIYDVGESCGCFDEAMNGQCGTCGSSSFATTRSLLGAGLVGLLGFFVARA